MTERQELVGIVSSSGNEQLPLDIIGGEVKIESSNVQNVSLPSLFERILSLQQQIVNQALTTQANINLRSGSFDERKLMESLRGLGETFIDLHGNRRTIKPEMFDNTPVVKKTSFKNLNTDSRASDIGTNKLCEVFTLSKEEIDEAELTVITGEPGSGKSVYLKTLQCFLLQNGYFPFALDFIALNSVTDKKSFVNLLKNSCPDHSFDETQNFFEWLTSNQKRCWFLVDGYDQSNFTIDEHAPNTNINNEATVKTWISLLFSKKIMKRSRVVFTSRPSSVLSLPVTHRPQLVYSLNGFKQDDLLQVIQVYNPQKADGIYKLVKEKGPVFLNLAQIPFVVALISLIFENESNRNIKSNRTLTELYNLAYDQLRKSNHNRALPEESDSKEKLVDKIYFEMHLKKKMSFTEEEVKRYGATVKDFENHSFVSLSSIETSNPIGAKDKIITPRHKSIMEFQISRHLVRSMDKKRFKVLLKHNLFDKNKLDMWATVRRFTAGLVFIYANAAVKREQFLKSLGVNLLRSTSKSLAGERACLKIDYRQKFHAETYEISLINDLTQVKSGIANIKSVFDKRSISYLDIRIDNAADLEGLMIFLEQVTSKFGYIGIELSSDVESESLQRLVSSLANQNVKTEGLHVNGINCGDANFADVIKNVELYCTLQYTNDVTIEKIEANKKALQDEINKFPKKSLLIEVEHCQHIVPIRHSMCTTKMSNHLYSLQSNPPSSKTTILDLCNKAGFQKRVYKQAGKNKDHFLFVLSTNDHISAFYKIVSDCNHLRIDQVRLYWTESINQESLDLFCTSILKRRKKILYLTLLNLTKSVITWEKLRLLIGKVKLRMDPMFTYDFCEADELEIERFRHEHYKENPDLDVTISFGSYRVRQIPSCISQSAKDGFKEKIQTCDEDHINVAKLLKSAVLIE